VVARSVYGEGTPFDHPAAMYGDENDSIVILDDVLVPWERVFSIGDPSFCQTIFPRISEWAHWSIIARLAVKAEVLTGLVALIPEIIGRDKQPQAQEALGEAIRYLLTLRAFLYASEDEGAVSASGYWMPDPIMVTAGRAYSVEHYRRLIGHLQDLASQGLIITPNEASLDNPVVGPALERLLETPKASARDRARLFRLAWDMVCDSYAGRQTLFELFNALPWTAQRAQLVARFDVQPLKDLAAAVSGIGSLGRAAAAVDQATQRRAVDYQVLGRAYHTYGGQRPLGDH
jgi:4-hydroxyphenylacetate 3-monooxygenase